MNVYADKTNSSRSRALAHEQQQKGKQSSTFQFVDNRPEAVVQRALQSAANAQTTKHDIPSSQKENKTGLPESLKTGVENLSGYSMDDVRVHYNSSKPAQLQAHAFAQGTNIHLGSGQEKHLPHEAWHVVQQKQGRVRPTIQLKNNLSINTEEPLEKEADVKGTIAMNAGTAMAAPPPAFLPTALQPSIIQRLSAPLTKEDAGKTYEIRLGHTIVYGRFDVIGRNGMHNFIQLGGEDDGELIRVHYVNIIREVLQVPALAQPGHDLEDGVPTSGRELNTEKMFASRLPTHAPTPPPASGSSRRKPATPKRLPLHQQGTEVLVGGSGVNYTKIHDYLRQYEAPPTTSLKMRTTGQRLELNTQTSQPLREQLDSRKKKGPRKQYIDPSYHETVQYMNVEYAAFCARAADILNPQEMRIAYDILLANQQTTSTPDHISATGPSPLTTMTPALLGKYQNLHYRTELETPDSTSTTRTYEAQYTHEITTNLPTSHWRSMSLPEESSDRETSMIDAIGAPLDVQVPTSGNTIGQGKIYSAIYKHFQRTMELLNQHLDKTQGAYSPASREAFKKRTADQSSLLDSNIMLGLKKNEEEHFTTNSGFATWTELEKTIDTISILIAASLDAVPENPSENFQVLILLDDLNGNGSALVKQFELIGTIIGLLIKKEKRLVMNYTLLQKDQKVKECLNNLYELHRVETEINKQIPLSKYNFRQLIHQEQQSRSFRKDADTLFN